MKVLINRSDAIGDTILTLPMAARIKEDYPQAEIIFIISPKSADLFKNHPHVDDVWILNHKTNFFRKLNYLWGRIGQFNPDAFIHVGGSFLPAFVAWLKRLKFRGGLKSKWLSFLFLNQGIHQMRSFVAQHESDYNLNLLGPLGIHYDFHKRSKYAPQVKLEDNDIFDNYQKFINDHNLDSSKELIFIHPGMSGHTLNWSSRNYARLIKRLNDRFPDKFTYVISHTPSDAKYLEGINSFLGEEDHKDLKKSIVFFNGSEHGLYHYMCVLKNAKIFIGPSTGTTHIANTLGVKVVSIYSPIKVQSAMRWSPFDRSKEMTRLLIPDVVCGEYKKCIGRSCPYYECMDKIEISDVLKQIMDMGALSTEG